MNPVELLRRMVEINSTTGNESELADFLAANIPNSTIDEVGNVIIGRYDAPIVFVGHMDTVHPFLPVREEDGLLYGRGSVDAKASLAAFISAASGNENIAVVGCVAEEGDSRGARHIAAKFSPQFSIIGEPSGVNGITISYRGAVRPTIEFTVPTFHSANPSQRNALEQAVDYYNNLRSEFPNTIISIRQLDGSAASATLSLVIRTQSEHEQLAERFPGAYNDSPFSTDKNNALARALVSAIRGQGLQPVFKRKTGTSDMNVLGPVWNCPMVAYGPGDSSLDHTPGEHIDLNEYLMSIQVIKRVVECIGLTTLQSE